jgi:hypothetical protein
MRRRRGQETGPQGGGADAGALPEPAPRAGDRPGIPGQRLLRRPGRGAGQVRDGAQGQGWRRPGHRGRRGVRVLPPGLLRRGRGAGVGRARRAGAGQARAARRPQADQADPRLGRGAAGRRPGAAPGAAAGPDRGRLRRARATPVRSRKRWPAARSATPKAADLPARETRKEGNPSLSLLPSPGHAAAEPGTCLDAGQDPAPGGGLDARYEELRHAALHARGEAFPLGLGVLAGKGVTAWQRAAASLAPAGRPAPACLPPPAGKTLPLPAGLAAELVSALAAVTLAGAAPDP